MEILGDFHQPARRHIEDIDGPPAQLDLRCLASPAGLIKEPDPALSLVNPILEQARRGDVAVLVA